MKRIVIIGGGIAGLSAGIFAQRNGFESVILEQHHTVGGECTGWDRQGHHIDGCIHWLVGTREGTAIKRLWETVGALDGVEIHEPESFLAVEHDGVTVHFYRDLDRLQESWMEISPRDADAIEEFCADIRRLHAFSLPVGQPLDMMNLAAKIKYILSMRDVGPVMQKYDRLSVRDLAGKFEHPALREALASFMPEGPYSASSVLFPLGTFTGGQASIPKGGSRALALRMAKRYRSLGGTVRTACEAVGLNIENGRVRRVECTGEESFAADQVIAACDAKVVYDRLLQGRYPDRAFEKRFLDPERYPLASNLYVGIGYAGTMEDVPRTLRFQTGPRNIRQNGQAVEYLQLTHYAHEPDFAPNGHSVMTVAINQFKPELDRWEALAKDKEDYDREKRRIGEEVIQAVQARFPHMTGKLTLLDVATPQTYNRICGAYRGAFMGFWPTIPGKSLLHDGRIKGLDNMVLSGQWLQPPGGLPVALITGKDTIMRLCRKTGRPFFED